jgi:DNA-binding SARP family transcriptional activator
MDFRLLGPLEVWDGERQLPLAGPKRRAVLAFLLLHRNEVVAVDRLVDQIWGEKALRNAAAALHTHVSRLRRELGPEVVATRAWGYVLRTEPGEVDLERFEQLVADADNLPARERGEKLREALALWRGSALEDLSFEPALATDIAQLDELRLTVLENRIDADLEAGTQAGLVGELEALIAAHPLRERLRAQLILALYRSGRQAEALEVYRETRRVLADELGLEPSPDLRELERAILQQDPALRASPSRAAVTAQPGVRPGRKRRILVSASLGVLLAGLGAVAAYALSTRTTRQGAQRQSTSLSVTGQTRPNGAAVLRTTSTTQTTAAHPVTTSRPSQHKHHHHHHRHRGTGPTRTVTVSTGTTQVVTGHHHHKHRGSKPVTISDAFGDDYIHPLTWSKVQYGGDVSALEQGGQLQLIVGAAAVPGGPNNQIDVHVATQCSFPGDFDARVQYKFLEWPAGDNIDVGLNATDAAAAVMRDNSSQSGDEYTSWATPGNNSVPFSAMGGSLRIARVGGIETTYYWHGAGWQKLASSREIGPAVIGLQALSDGQNPFGGQEVKVAFDNFTVTGANPDCPGARPAHG